MDEIKGRLTIFKPGCRQVIIISRKAYVSMKGGVYRVFNDIMNDLGGYKWEFDKVD